MKNIIRYSLMGVVIVNVLLWLSGIVIPWIISTDKISLSIISFLLSLIFIGTSALIVFFSRKTKWK